MTAKDTARPLPEREKQAEQQARQAVELLHKARSAGYFQDRDNREHLDRDSDLLVLREREDFRRFRAELEKKSGDGR